MGKPTTRQSYGLLFGGLNKKATDILVSQSPESPLQGQDLINTGFDKLGGWAKRKGKERRGDVVSSSASPLNQPNNFATFGATLYPNPSRVFQKITNSSGGNVIFSSMTIAVSSSDGVAIPPPAVTVNIKADAAGSPGSVITNGTSASVNVTIGTTPVNTVFTFPASVTLADATDYWIEVAAFQATDPLYVGYDNTSGSDMYEQNWSTLMLDSVGTGTLFFLIAGSSVSEAIQGLYDYQVSGAGGSFSQKVLVAMGDGSSDSNLFTHAGPTPIVDDTGAWTPIHTFPGSDGQDVLFDFVTANNYVFVTDYATNIGQVWDGSALSTSPHGYRPEATVTFTAGAGAWTAAGLHTVMLVTSLKSGGFRAKTYDVTLGATTEHIDVDSVAIDDISIQFGFDIDTDATRVFIKTPGLDRYHLLLASQMANFAVSAQNPLDNTETSFDVNGATDGTLDGQDTLLDVYGLDDEYFTLQEDTPKLKFMDTGDGFLFGAGDPLNPSRLWITALNHPQIFSGAGGTDGTFIEVGAENDGQKINGVKHAMGSVFVFKDRDVWRYKFTGNAAAPFIGEKMRNNDISALSHFAIEEAPMGLVFPTQGGMAISDGVSIKRLGDNEIGSFFETSTPDRFNLSAMKFSTSLNHTNKQQLWFGVSSTGATTRDRVFIFDYQLGSWSLHDGIQGNYFANITDADGFSQPWSGDYLGNVSEHDFGTNDSGAAIAVTWQTPWFVFGDIDGETRVRRVSVKGDIQAAGTLQMEVYLDYSSTVTATFNFDMTDTRFERGLDLPVNYKGRAISLKFKNAEVDTDVQVQAITLYYQNLGARR